MVISESETTVKAAGVPLKVTEVVPVNPLPRMYDGSSGRGAARHGSDQGRKPEGEAEDATVARGSPVAVGTIKITVGVLGHAGGGVLADGYPGEFVYGGQSAARVTR